MLGPVHQVPLVEGDDQPLPGLVHLRYDPLLLRGQAVHGVHQEHRHVAARYAPHRPRDTVELDVALDPGPAPEAGRVDQAVLHALPGDLRVHRVARRAGDVGDDHRVPAHDGVDQRRFPHVGPAHDRHLDRAVVLFFDRRGFGHPFRQQVHQVARIASLQGGDHHGLAQSQSAELVGVVFLGAAVHLVGDDDDLLAGPADDFGRLLVQGRDARADVRDQQDHVGFADGQPGLLLDGGLHGLVGFRDQAPRVHHGELLPEPVGVGVMPVPRDARGVVHDGVAAADHPVEQHRFAHVGASYDGDDR